ncbi:YvcK family protein [Kamptonema cortianum]|nr:YvcK family protein [Geitlerinema splendidum]MDK3157056.1 YvcK family protein [Kamptonema cortianum]
MKRRKIKRRWQTWFGPTAELVRHIALGLVGICLAVIGLFMSFQSTFIDTFATIKSLWGSFASALSAGGDPRVVTHLTGGLLMLGGSLTAYRGLRAFFRLLGNTNGDKKSTLVTSYVRRQQLARGPKIVALGGGTGMSTLLRGLKQYSSNITAIVTVSDDGGSSGRLVQELGIIPPGDMRNCLVALADAEKTMTDLFQMRFTSTMGPFSGHSLGNVLIAGLVEQAGGDFDRALKLASEVLAIRGRVIPSTTTRVTLRALMEDGTELAGETAIVDSHLRIQRIFLCPDNPVPHQAALDAIADADLICLGPGSVYTSVIPNLLVPGIAEACNQSGAVKAYICNVMTQPGESDQFTAAEHVVAIQANVPNKTFDYVLVNTGTPSQQLVQRYHASGQELVVPDTDRLKQMGYKPVPGNLMNETDYVRHDPLRVAARLMSLLK